jgi:hypothetical protein
MQKILINNSGLIIEHNVNNREITPFNFGLIGSSTPSMINDVPDREQIRLETCKIRIVDTDLNKSLTIPDFTVLWTIRKNRSLLKEQFEEGDADLGGFSVNTTEFNVTGLSKSGAMLKDGELDQVRRMALNDAHYQYFEKDFLSYFLYLNFSGKVVIFNNLVKKNEHIKFKFSRIPLLCFKSENASNNDLSMKISISMLKILSGKNTINAIFL